MKHASTLKRPTQEDINRKLDSCPVFQDVIKNIEDKITHANTFENKRQVNLNLINNGPLKPEFYEQYNQTTLVKYIERFGYKVHITTGTSFSYPRLVISW